MCHIQRNIDELETNGSVYFLTICDQTLFSLVLNLYAHNQYKSGEKKMENFDFS